VDDVEEIVQLAKKLMFESGYHEPIVFFKGTEGKGVVALETFGKDADERTKDMLNAGALAGIKRNVGELELIVFVSEAWMGRAIKKEEDYILPSSDPKRVEVLIITYLDTATKEQAMRMFEVVRDSQKRIIDLKQNSLPDVDSIKSPLLPAFLKGYQLIRPVTN
jgi:hypothetical protein